MKFLKRIKTNMTGQSSSSRLKMISALPLFDPHCVQLHLFLGVFGYIVLRRPLLFCSTSCNKPWSIKSPQIIHQIESDSAMLLLHLQWWVKHSICSSVLFAIFTAFEHKRINCWCHSIYDIYNMDMTPGMTSVILFHLFMGVTKIWQQCCAINHTYVIDPHLITFFRFVFKWFYTRPEKNPKNIRFKFWAFTELWPKK